MICMKYKDPDVAPGDLLLCRAVFYSSRRKGKQLKVPDTHAYYFVREVYFELRTQVTYVRLEEVVNEVAKNDPYEIGFPLWAFDIVDRADNIINI